MLDVILPDIELPELRESIAKSGDAPLVAIIEERVAILYPVPEPFSPPSVAPEFVALLEQQGHKIVPFRTLDEPLGPDGDGYMLAIIEGRVAVFVPPMEGLSVESQFAAHCVEMEGRGIPVENVNPNPQTHRELDTDDKN
jgi:hypothetical protein